MTQRPEAPNVSLVGIKLSSMSLFEQTFRVKLRLDNPNNYELPLDGFQIDLKLNDQAFLSGSSIDSVTLPRLGSVTVEMDAVSKLSGLLQQLQGIRNGEAPKLRYSLAGRVHLIKPFISLPLKEEGELDMSWLEQR